MESYCHCPQKRGQMAGIKKGSEPPPSPPFLLNPFQLSSQPSHFTYQEHLSTQSFKMQFTFATVVSLLAAAEVASAWQSQYTYPLISCCPGTPKLTPFVSHRLPRHAYVQRPEPQPCPSRRQRSVGLQHLWPEHARRDVHRVRSQRRSRRRLPRPPAHLIHPRRYRRELHLLQRGQLQRRHQHCPPRQQLRDIFWPQPSQVVQVCK